MIILPNESTPHNLFVISFYIDPVIDGRGLSKAKTQALVNTMPSQTIDFINRTFLGLRSKPVSDCSRKSECERVGLSYLVRIEVPLPLNCSIDALRSKVDRYWQTTYNRNIEAYVEVHRRYTESEILEHCW
jgi:hypothetical protein